MQPESSRPYTSHQPKLSVAYYVPEDNPTVTSAFRSRIRQYWRDIDEDLAYPYFIYDRSGETLVYTLTIANAGPNAVVSAVLDDVPANLLLRRPDIRAAELKVAAQSARIGIAEADLYPAITLLGSIGWSASSVDGAADNLDLGAAPACAGTSSTTAA